MSNEIGLHSNSGETWFLCRFQLNGNVLLSNGASDELWGAGGNNADNYDKPIPEKGSSGHYVGDFDSDGNITAEYYRVAAYRQAGANPADSDLPARFEAVGYWDGSEFITLFTLKAVLEGGVNVTQISGDSAAADNLESQYDGEGLLGDTFPLRQDQGAGIAGGLAVRFTMASVTVIQGSQQDLSNANTSDDNRWTGDDDGSGAEFIFRCTPTDTSDIPIDLHFEGYYDEPGAPFNNTATLQIYDFQDSQWDTILTFSNANQDEIHDILISHIHKSANGGTIEGVSHTQGDVLIKFKQDTQETGNACLLIDYITVGYVGSLVTADKIKTAIEADGSTLDFIKNIAEGDLEIDTSTTPWQMVIKKKGTSTELVKKDLKDKDGNDIVNVNALIGKYLEP